MIRERLSGIPLSRWSASRGAPSMAKAAQSHDLKIAYAGAALVLEPQSPAGEQWVAEHVTAAPHWRIQYPLGARLQQGATAIRLRYLDEVLHAAERARLRLEVPWE
jgi:hypothetical protein